MTGRSGGRALPLAAASLRWTIWLRGIRRPLLNLSRQPAESCGPPSRRHAAAHRVGEKIVVHADQQRPARERDAPVPHVLHRLGERATGAAGPGPGRAAAPVPLSSDSEGAISLRHLPATEVRHLTAGLDDKEDETAPRRPATTTEDAATTRMPDRCGTSCGAELLRPSSEVRERRGRSLVRSLERRTPACGEGGGAAGVPPCRRRISSGAPQREVSAGKATAAGSCGSARPNGLAGGEGGLAGAAGALAAVSLAFKRRHGSQTSARNASGWPGASSRGGDAARQLLTSRVSRLNDGRHGPDLLRSRGWSEAHGQPRVGPVSGGGGVPVVTSSRYCGARPWRSQVECARDRDGCPAQPGNACLTHAVQRQLGRTAADFGPRTRPVERRDRRAAVPRQADVDRSRRPVRTRGRPDRRRRPCSPPESVRPPAVRQLDPPSPRPPAG